MRQFILHLIRSQVDNFQCLASRLKSNLKGARHALLPAGDVEAGRGDGLVGPSLEAAAVMNHLEERVGSVGDRFGQVDPVGHRRDGPERVDESPVRAADGAAVGVERLAVSVEPGGAGRRADHGGEVAAAEESVLGTADARSVVAAFLVAESSPLRADVDDAVADDEAALGADHVSGAVVLITPIRK